MTVSGALCALGYVLLLFPGRRVICGFTRLVTVTILDSGCNTIARWAMRFVLLSTRRLRFLIRPLPMEAWNIRVRAFLLVSLLTHLKLLKIRTMRSSILAMILWFRNGRNVMGSQKMMLLVRACDSVLRLCDLMVVWKGRATLVYHVCTFV